MTTSAACLEHDDDLPEAPTDEWNHFELDADETPRAAPSPRTGPVNVRPLRHAPKAAPHSPEAEQGILAACLFDGVAAVDAARVLVAPSDFYAGAHRLVFEAALATRDAGLTVDLTTVVDHLRTSGRLHAIGGLTFLQSLLRAPAPGSLSGYLRLVREHADTRELLDGLRLAVAADDLVSADDVLAAIDGVTARVRERRAHAAIPWMDGDALFAPLEAPAYLVDGVARRGSVLLLGAYGSSGKTWVALDAALAVARGLKWLGRYQCAAGRVAILDYESGPYELRRRLQSIDALLGGESAPAIDAACFPGLYVTDPAFPARLEAVAKGRHLVVIDSLAALSPGVDENSSAMRVGLDHMRRIAEATGCVFMVLVHAKKTGADPDAIDAREIFRGSSAIYDAADTCIAVTKKKGQMVATQTKARHGRMVDPFALEIVDVNGGVQVRAVEVEADEPPPTPADHFNDLCAEVLLYVRRNPGASASAIEGAIPGRATKLRNAVTVLVEQGRLAEMPGARGARTFHAAGAT